MPPPLEAPSWRKPVGMLLILVLIFTWAGVILIAAPVIVTFAWPLQAAFFAVVGTIWIMPLKPMLRWMEAGNIR